MQCRFRRAGVQCENDARPGWTTCARHYSAGRTGVSAKPPEPTREERDRLYDAADTIAVLLGVDPETIMAEPSALRISLTLDQAERLIAIVRSTPPQS